MTSEFSAWYFDLLCSRRTENRKFVDVADAAKFLRKRESVLEMYLRKFVVNDDDFESDSSTKAIKRLSVSAFKRLCMSINSSQSIRMLRAMEALEDTYHQNLLRSSSAGGTFNVVKDEYVYVGKEGGQLDSQVHKVGKSINVRKREAQFNTGNSHGFKMLYKCATCNSMIAERVVHYILRRYNCGREYFECDVEHSINVTRLVCSFLDTLVSLSPENCDDVPGVLDAVLTATRA